MYSSIVVYRRYVACQTIHVDNYMAISITTDKKPVLYGMQNITLQL